MRRFRSAYGSYRGRRTLNDILKIVAVILAVLVILLVGVLAFGQNYIVFTDNGIQMDLPFLQQKPEEETPLDPGDISVVVQPAGSQEETLGDDEDQTAGLATMAALELPVSALADGTAAQQLEQAGANALVLEMKNEQGQLGWVSQQSYAVRAGLNSSQAEINQLLTDWNQGEVYTVARVCCFRDNTIPYEHNDLALHATYGNWRDEQKLRWLNPDSEAARNYLVSLCQELAQLGFDEIVLEQCAFPTQGSLSSIVQSGSYAGQPQDKQAVVAGFLEQVNQAVSPYGTKVSVRADADLLSGGDTVSGLTVGTLEAYADRLWMAEDGMAADLEEALTQAGFTDASSRLVAITSALSGADGTSCAVLETT
jgi:hypothetical protein